MIFFILMMMYKILLLNVKLFFKMSDDNVIMSHTQALLYDQRAQLTDVACHSSDRKRSQLLWITAVTLWSVNGLISWKWCQEIILTPLSGPLKA